jgi:hypothetical protein
MNKWVAVTLVLLLSGCTSQFALGPAAWSAAPVIPGFTAVPLPGGGFVEEPNSLLQQQTAPAATPEQTTLQAIQEAQAMREAIRKFSDDEILSS